MRKPLLVSFALLVGCHLPQGKERTLDLIVEQEGPGALSCSLTNNSSEIYMVKGTPNGRPVPDTEYQVEGDWIVDNLGWCQYKVELFQMDPGESIEFVVKVDSQRPARLGLDVKRVVFNLTSDGAIDSISGVPARIVSRLSNQPLQTDASRR